MRFKILGSCLKDALTLSFPENAMMQRFPTPKAFNSSHIDFCVFSLSKKGHYWFGPAIYYLLCTLFSRCERYRCYIVNMTVHSGDVEDKSFEFISFGPFDVGPLHSKSVRECVKVKNRALLILQVNDEMLSLLCRAVATQIIS